MYRPGQRQTDLRTDPGHPATSLGGALPFPTEALIDETGEPVTLLQTCDWPGHSPSLVGVDNRGKFLVASFAEVSVVDARIVPNASIAEIRSRITSRAAA
jgi:hypothetical protein